MAPSRVGHGRPVALAGLTLLASAFACRATPDTAAAVGPTARFTTPTAGLPAFMDVPFPSDIYLDNGSYRDLPGIEGVVTQTSPAILAAMKKVDGWSRTAASHFYIDDAGKPAGDDGSVGYADLDPASLPDTEAACSGEASAVFLLDLEASDLVKARIGCRASYHDDQTAGASRTRPSLAVGPARGLVLAEGHRYAAIVTSRVKDKAGRRLSKGASLDGASSGPLRAVYQPALDKARALLGASLARDGAEIVAIAPYTTQKVTATLQGMRDDLEKSAAPKLSWAEADVAPMKPARFARLSGTDPLPAGFTASLDAWLGASRPKLPDGTDDPDEALPGRAHDQLARVGTAVFQADTYLQTRPRAYSDPEHGTFAVDAAGKPTLQGKTKIWVTFAIPTAPMPASGYPVVIVQHGLSSSREYLLTLANTFGRAGWASVAIDSVTFGARTADPTLQVDAGTDYEKAPGVTYKGPDGLSDTVNGSRTGPFDFFGGLKNIAALRDQLRQAGLDTAQLVKVLASAPDLAPLAGGGVTPRLDADRIAYVGDSLGAIEGAVAAAFEPRVRAWTLNVGGGGIFTEIAGYGPGISAQISVAGALNFGFRGDRFDESHILVSLMQTVSEAGDPIAYAGRLVMDTVPLSGTPTPPRNILQIEVLYDELIPNEASEALARAGAWGVAAPNAGLNAGTVDLKTPQARRGAVFLPEVKTGEANSPRAGSTAVMVQISPATHGANIVGSHGTRSFVAPYGNRRGGGGPFTLYDEPARYQVACPYREIQRGVVAFLGEAFDGRVPKVPEMPLARRDIDGDGKPDDQDPNPNKP